MTDWNMEKAMPPFTALRGNPCIIVDGVAIEVSRADGVAANGKPAWRVIIIEMPSLPFGSEEWSVLHPIGGETFVTAITTALMCLSSLGTTPVHRWAARRMAGVDYKAIAPTWVQAWARRNWLEMNAIWGDVLRKYK